MVIQKLSDGTYRTKQKDASKKISSGDFTVTEKKKWKIMESEEGGKKMYTPSISNADGMQSYSIGSTPDLKLAKDALKKRIKRDFGTNI